MKKTRIMGSGLKMMSRHKMQTFFMTIGIIIGITTLTIIYSLGKGTEKKVMKRVEKFGLSSLMIRAGSGKEIGRPTGDDEVTLTMEDITELQNKIENITYSAPIQRFSSGIKFKENSTSAPIFGTTPDWEPIWDWGVTNGEFFTEQDLGSLSRVALLGPTVKKELFGDDDPVGMQIRIKNVLFTVKGVLISKGTSPRGGDMDNRIIIPITTLMKRLMNVDNISMAKILLNDHRKMNETIDEITNILRTRHHLSENDPDDFQITTPVEVIKFASKISGTFNIFLILLAGISLIVGGIVIANLMFVSINERRSEIGLRKAVGARSKDILLQFIIETTMLTIIGGFIGIVLGITGVKVVSVLFDLPVAISWEIIVLGFVISSLTGIIAGVFPARKAALLDPIITLK